MENFWKDIQYGSRMLLKHPGFTAVAVLSLALGIGVNSTIFTLVNAVLLRPLPVSDPERLVQVYSGSEEFQYSTNSYLDYVDFRDGSDVFEELAAHSMMAVAFTHEGRTELILGEIATANYFQVLGVEPALGRGFLPEEDETEGVHPVVVLSHGFWQRRFGGDPSAVGGAIRLNGRVYTIVGVAPETFTGTIPGFSPELWIPMMMSEDIRPMGINDVEPSPTGTTRLEKRGTRWLFIKGHLKPGRSVEQAQAELQTIQARLEKEYPESNEGRMISVVPAGSVRLHPMIDEALRPAALLILAVVGMVLLIACANVANMLLARATARRQEIAVRLAIGAGRGRLLRQLLTESLLLAGLGGLLGLLLAYWTSGLLLKLQPPGSLQLSLDLGLDGRVLTFTLGASLVSALAFGLVPALRASRPELAPSLRNEATQMQRGDRRFGLRNLLVIGQVAISLVLLIGAALLIRSLQNAHTIDVGFDIDRLAVMAVDLGFQSYSDEQAEGFYRRLIDRVEAMPGIRSAALVQRLPLSTSVSATGLYIEGHQQTPDDRPFIVYQTAVGPHYFRTMGVPLLEGRDFNESDTEDSPRTAIVNETLARRYWPGETAVGKRFHQEGLDGPECEIIGVSRDYKVGTLGEAPRPYVHFARAQDPSTFANLVARTDGDPAVAVENLRREMLAMDPNLVFMEADTLRSIAAVTLLPVRLGALLVGVFGALGLLLAAIGLYGVIAFSVSRRTHEIGMRMALGAEARDVLGLILRQGMAVALVGVAVGTASAAALSRFLSSVLFVSPVDPVSFAAPSILLLSVALSANYIPAHRAARADPVVALKHE